MTYNFLRARLQPIEEQDALQTKYQRYLEGGGQLGFDEWLKQEQQPHWLQPTQGTEEGSFLRAAAGLPSEKPSGIMELPPPTREAGFEAKKAFREEAAVEPVFPWDKLPEWITGAKALQAETYEEYKAGGVFNPLSKQEWEKQKKSGKLAEQLESSRQFYELVAPTPADVAFVAPIGKVPKGAKLIKEAAEEVVKGVVKKGAKKAAAESMVDVTKVVKGVSMQRQIAADTWKKFTVEDRKKVLQRFFKDTSDTAVFREAGKDDFFKIRDDVQAVVSGEKLPSELSKVKAMKVAKKVTSKEVKSVSSESQKTGTCYVDAGRFQIKNGGTLVHGSVQASKEGKRINHAWVLLDDGKVFEPQTKQIFAKTDFDKFFRPEINNTYTPEQTAIKVVKEGAWGAWDSPEFQAAKQVEVAKAVKGGKPPVKPPKPPTAEAAPELPPTPRKPIWEGKTEGGQPPVEPPTKPTAEAAPELPSGRKPGGEGRAIAHDVQTPTEYEKAVEALTPTEYPLKAKFKATSEAFMRKFYANWYPLRRLSEKSGVRADYMAQIVPGATAHGQDVVRRTLDPVFSRIGSNIDHLEQYMSLKHDLDIAARFPEARLPGKVAGAGGAQTALNQLKVKIGAEQFVALERAGDELWKAHKEITIDRLVQEGLKTKEEAQVIVSAHPHYLPFQREDYIDDIGQAMSRPTASVSSTGIKKMDEVGSWLKLDNPLARFRTDAIKVENVIARNRAARGIVDALREMERQTGQSLVTLVGGTEADRVAYGFANKVDKAKTTLDVGYMSYFVDGKKFMVEVPRIIADVAKGIGDESVSAIVSAIRSTNIPLQKGAVTYNPAFLVVNPLRDALSALFREKLVPFGRDWWAGFKSAVTKDATFQEAAREGALYSGIVETMRSSKSMSKSFGQTGAISLRSPQDALLVVPRLISKLGGKIESANIVLEQATRLGTWKKLKAAGVDSLEAAVRTRDVTVDFAKMGSVMRQINAIIPFSNASLQGSVNTFRTIRDKPAWAATATMLFASPTVMSRAWNMQFDTSKEIPEYEYTNNWVIQIGEAMSKDNKKLPIYVKIPKGQIGSLLTFPAEVIFNAAQRNDDRTVLAMLLQSGIEAGRASSPFDPTISGILPPAVKTTVGIAFKTNPYTFLPIVPQSQQALPPEQQFGAETSAQSIAIGQKFKVSPRLIDFAVRDYTAGTGQAGMWLIDTALKGLGYKSEVYGSALTSKPSTAESLTSAPVVSRFLGAKGTGEERTLWELFRNKTTETKREFNQIPLMNSLGINLGEVGDSISNVDLTADQKIRYQQFMSEIVTEGVKEFSRSLSGTPEQQREAVQKEMRRLKDLAKDAFAAQEGIPVDVGGGLKIKSAPSTNTRKTGLLKPVRIK